MLLFFACLLAAVPLCASALVVGVVALNILAFTGPTNLLAYSIPAALATGVFGYMLAIHSLRPQFAAAGKASMLLAALMIAIASAPSGLMFFYGSEWKSSEINRARAMHDFVSAQFAKLDQNGDQIITKREIDLSLDDFSGKERAILLDMRSSYQDLGMEHSICGQDRPVWKNFAEDDCAISEFGISQRDVDEFLWRYTSKWRNW